jgi:hypothetical protein
MPLFKDSYQTTVGSVLVTKPIEHSLKVAFIKDALDHVSLDVRRSGDVKPVFVIGSMSSEADIPLFTHPILVLDQNREQALCTDLRFFVKKGTSASDVASGVRNQTEYNFAKSRAILNLMWVSDRVGEIRNGLPFAGVVYAAWLSESIAKTFALDYSDQTVVAIITHFFYQTLFSEETEFDEEAKQRMAAHTMKATKAPSELVFKVFDKIGPMKDINEYCRAVAEGVENVRLKDFNLASLLHLVKNSWYGTNSKEIISVALEHPPTWAAIVYTALVERSYRGSMVYRIAERHGKRGAADEFLKSYAVMIRENTKDTRPQQVVALEMLAELDDFK